MSLKGIWAAVVTPIDTTYQPDCARAIAYYEELLDTGCDGINLLGTTGEAMSFSVKQRELIMEGVAESGLPMHRIMVGTGASSLDDSIALKRIADRLGFAAALMMPPFFYREAGDNGVLRFFDIVLSDANEIPVILYNFPKMSGITFTPSLVGRIIDAHPNRIIGVKDSSNTLEYEREILAHFPKLRVFPGSEELLASGLAIGDAGCISGTVCLWPQLAQEVFLSGDPAKAHELEEKRRAIARPLIPAVRQLIAKDRDEPAWLRTMPPL